MEIGDVFYHSWGYDQINIDFIVVVGFTKSGKSAICQRCKSINDPLRESFCEFALKPTGEAFGDKFRMRIHKSDLTNVVILRGSYPYLHNGKIKSEAGQKIVLLGTFFPTTKEEFFYETKPQFGH